MEKKFELTEEFIINNSGIKLYRIKALKDFSDVKKGDLGGYVQQERNLSQFGNAWVCDDAQVCGNAQVYSDAWICGNAKVYGDAWIYGNAKVYGDAKVFGDVIASGEHVYDTN